VHLYQIFGYLAADDISQWRRLALVQKSWTLLSMYSFFKPCVEVSSLKKIPQCSKLTRIQVHDRHSHKTNVSHYDLMSFVNLIELTIQSFYQDENNFDLPWMTWVLPEKQPQQLVHLRLVRGIGFSNQRQNSHIWIGNWPQSLQHLELHDINFNLVGFTLYMLKQAVINLKKVTIRHKFQPVDRSWLQYCINLEVLSISSSSTTPFLPCTLTKLQQLTLRGDVICLETLMCIAELSNLQQLYLDCTSSSSVFDVTTISNLTCLQILSISNMQFQNPPNYSPSFFKTLRCIRTTLQELLLFNCKDAGSLEDLKDANLIRLRSFCMNGLDVYKTQHLMKCIAMAIPTVTELALVDYNLPCSLMPLQTSLPNLQLIVLFPRNGACCEFVLNQQVDEWREKNPRVDIRLVFRQTKSDIRFS